MTFFLPFGSRLTVDLAALVANWRLMDARARPGRAGAVVKADAYGLGAAPVSKALWQAGCRAFFVAFPQEGAELAAHLPDAEIFVFNCIDDTGLATCRDLGLIPILNSTTETGWWLKHAAKPAALMIDTGMNRLGLTEAEALICAGHYSPRLVLSHLACSDEPDHAMNTAQTQSFQRVVSAFAQSESSLANSGGHFHEPVSGLSRPGIALYGGAPVNDAANPMRPVATLEARITQIRRASAGETVSYGATQMLARDSLIAVAAIGYADGYPRAASASGVPLRADGSPGGTGFINGRRVPILGRVTMDAVLFDVTDCTDAKPGDWIELFGKNIPLDEAASVAGTISYEMLTALGRRIERCFLS